MASTRTVATETTEVRRNDDGSVVYIKVVTYSSGTPATDRLEILVDRVVPGQ